MFKFNFNLKILKENIKPINSYLTKDHWKRFYGCLILMGLVVISDIFSIILIPKITSKISSNEIYGSIYILGIYIIFVILNSFVRGNFIRVSFKLAHNISTLYSFALYQIPMLSSLDLYEVKPVDRYISAINTKCNFIATDIIIPIIQLISSSLSSLAICLSVIVLFPVRGTFFLIIVCFIYYGLSKYFSRIISKNGKKINEYQNLLFNLTNDSLNNTNIINNFNLTDEYFNKYKKIDLDLRNSFASNNTLSVLPRYIMESVAIFLLISIGLIPVLLGLSDIEKSISLLIVLAYSCQKLLPIIQTVNSSFLQIQGQKSSFKEILELCSVIDYKYDYLVNNKFQDFSRVKKLSNLIKNKNLILNIYIKQRSTLTSDLSNAENLQIITPNWYFIDAQSGIGKTYFLKSILRFKSILKNNPKISFLDKKNLRLTIKEYWSLFAYSPQEIHLLNTSLLHNVICVYPDEELDLSNYYKKIDYIFNILNLKQELDISNSSMDLSYLNKSVKNLSGGQKQRVAIARALLRNPRFLILDESLSGVSKKLRVQILERIKKEFTNLSVLMVLHGFEKPELLFEKTIKYNNKKSIFYIDSMIN